MRPPISGIWTNNHFPRLRKRSRGSHFSSSIHGRWKSLFADALRFRCTCVRVGRFPPLEGADKKLDFFPRFFCPAEWRAKAALRGGRQPVPWIAMEQGSIQQ